MSSVHVQMDIDAPVERVWDTIMDPHRFADWVTIHRSVENVSGSPATRGATMDQAIQIRGVTFRVHWTLTSVDPPNRAEWEGLGPAHSRARILYELSERGESTSFEYTNEFTVPGGRLGTVASRVIVGATSERAAHKSLLRLKQVLEHD
jgi:uncharacterized protein YndB with AHSA1/START domain